VVDVHRALSVFVALLLFVSASSSRADEPAQPTLHWGGRWPRFRPVEYVLTGVVGAAATAEYWLVPAQATPHWTGGILFDDGVRGALRLNDPSARHTAWGMADAVDVSLVAIVLGVDSLLVPLVRGSGGVGLQLAAIDAESFAYSSILTFTLYDTVGRARPSYADCKRDPTLDNACRTSPTASFPSGHVNEAFTAAGLSCAQHLSLPLYGSRVLDILACARDLTLATADGVLRVVGDRHYATDVLAGGGIGFAFGYAMPMLLHFRAGPDGNTARLSFAPLTGNRIGIVASGEL
jgi:membrane-associated phospholipid phosphatase